MENPEASSIPTPAISTPPVEAPKPSRKLPVSWILGVLVVFLLATTAFLGYQNIQLTQKKSLMEQPIPCPSPIEAISSNWKQLDNTYGYTLKYPETFKALGVGIQVDETTAPTVIISKNPDNTQEDGITIDVVDKSSTVFRDLTLQEIAQTNFKANQDNKYTFISTLSAIENIVFAAKPAYTYSIVSKGFSGQWSGWGGGKNQKLKIIEAESSGEHYIIIYSLEDPIFDQILSTFKFLD